MSVLQTVLFGAASDGSQGDSTRTAFTKDNANVAILNAQAALTSFATTLTTGAALTAPIHLGKRVNINVTTAQTFNLPTAASCGADGVILLRNLGTVPVTLAVTTGSGDTLSMTTLNGLETCVFDTDGVHAWNVLLRGRGTSANETVNGNSTVVGNETVGGTLGVAGNANLAGTLSVAGTASFGSTAQASISAAGVYSGTSAAYSGNVSVTGTLTRAGNAVWDAGNLTPGSYVLKAGAAPVSISVAGTGAVVNATLLLQGGVGIPYLGMLGNGNASGAQLRVTTTSGFDVVNISASGYLPVAASAFNVGSDRAFKKDVKPLLRVMERLRSKQVVSYTLKQTGAEQIGVIAQDWVTDFPELVNQEGPEIDENGDFISHQYGENGEEIYGSIGRPVSRPSLSFNYGNLAAVALQGILETDALVQTLIARISALEFKLASEQFRS